MGMAEGIKEAQGVVGEGVHVEDFELFGSHYNIGFLQKSHKLEYAEKYLFIWEINIWLKIPMVFLRNEKV
jgi:hypothetical protein